MPEPSKIRPLLRKWRKEYSELGNEVVPYIEKLIRQGKTPEVAVNRAFKKFNVSKSLQNVMLDQMLTASAIGYGVEVVAKPQLLGEYYFNKVWPGESLSLSERIAKKETQQIIAQSIRQDLKKAANVDRLTKRLSDTSIKDWRPSGRIRAELPQHLEDLQAAARTLAPDDKRFIAAVRKSRNEVAKLVPKGGQNRLKAAYTELIDKIQIGKEKAVSKAVEIAYFDKGRYNAERIAQTEIARAYGISHDYQAEINSDVIGVRIELSSAHRIVDICDFHTRADFYGMGRGVYPKNRQPPYPFHPHCHCLKSEIYRDEAEIGKFNEKKAKAFLNSPPAGVRQRDLLGVQGAKDYKKGGDWKRLLKSWNGHARPDFSGIDKSWF